MVPRGTIRLLILSDRFNSSSSEKSGPLRACKYFCVVTRTTDTRIFSFHFFDYLNIYPNVSENLLWLFQNSQRLNDH